MNKFSNNMIHVSSCIFIDKENDNNNIFGTNRTFLNRRGKRKEPIFQSSTYETIFCLSTVIFHA